MFNLGSPLRLFLGLLFSFLAKGLVLPLNAFWSGLTTTVSGYQRKSTFSLFWKIYRENTQVNKTVQIALSKKQISFREKKKKIQSAKPSLFLLKTVQASVMNLAIQKINTLTLSYSLCSVSKFRYLHFHLDKTKNRVNISNDRGTLAQKYLELQKTES